MLARDRVIQAIHVEEPTLNRVDSLDVDDWKSYYTVLIVGILNCIRKRCFILPTDRSGIPDDS